MDSIFRSYLNVDNLRSACRQDICFGLKTDFPGTENTQSDVMITRSSGPVQPASGATASIKPDHSLVPDYSGISSSGIDQVTVQICDTQGSCTRRPPSVDVRGMISEFNAVCPNRDRKNDIFFIRFIHIFPNTKNNKVTIFNRWGNVVFDAENYDNVNRVFRRQNKSGNELPAGTYYTLDFTSGFESRKGFISLKR